MSQLSVNAMSLPPSGGCQRKRSQRDFTKRRLRRVEAAQPVVAVGRERSGRIFLETALRVVGAGRDRRRLDGPKAVAVVDVQHQPERDELAGVEQLSIRRRWFGGVGALGQRRGINNLMQTDARSGQ